MHMYRGGVQGGAKGFEPLHLFRFTKWAIFQITQICMQYKVARKKVPHLSSEPLHFSDGFAAPAYVLSLKNTIPSKGYFFTYLSTSI